MQHYYMQRELRLTPFMDEWDDISVGYDGSVWCVVAWPGYLGAASGFPWYGKYWL
jgi:hypothetical protein